MGGAIDSRERPWVVDTIIREEGLGARREDQGVIRPPARNSDALRSSTDRPSFAHYDLTGSRTRDHPCVNRMRSSRSR